MSRREVNFEEKKSEIDTADDSDEEHENPEDDEQSDDEDAESVEESEEEEEEVDDEEEDNDQEYPESNELSARCTAQFERLGFVDPAGKLEIDRMMQHVLDCAAAIRFARKEEDLQASIDEAELTSEQRDDRIQHKISANNVFTTALATILEYPHEIGNESTSAPFEALCGAFPDESKCMDGRGWLPLHWAVLLVGKDHDEDGSSSSPEHSSKVSIQDVMNVYLSDQDALKRHHWGVAGEGTDGVGFTPFHLIGMSQHPNMAVVRELEQYDHDSWTALACTAEPDEDEENGQKIVYRSIFHLIAEYTQSSTLLGHLIHTYPSFAEEVCSTTADADFYFPNTPLNILCSRDDFSELEWGRGNSAALCRMVAHLLEVECTESSLEEGSAVGQLLRDNVYVTYHVINALFDDLFKKQRDFPNGVLPVDTTDCAGVIALTIVERLLAICPQVAKYRTEPVALDSSTDEGDLPPPVTGACELLLHVATSFRGHFGACMVGQLYTIYPEAIHESLLSAQGSLPLQTATYYSTVDVMEYVLDLYPEACLLKAPSENHENLLHVAVDISSSSYACTGSNKERGSGSMGYEDGMLHSTTDEDYYRACVAGKVKLLCDRCPRLIKERDRRGFTPLHLALMNNNQSECGVNFQVVQAICEADPTVVGDRIEVDEIIDDQEYRMRYVGKLPLHLLIACNSFDSGGVSENADCFRYLLKRFPMAALLVDSEGKTPCDLAEEINMPIYFQRLIHKATFFSSAPLRTMNYNERRQALLLAFPKPLPGMDPTNAEGTNIPTTEEGTESSSSTAQRNKNIFCKLREQNQDLLQLVMSYI